MSTAPEPSSSPPPEKGVKEHTSPAPAPPHVKSERDVEGTRAWTGMYAVLGSDVAIALAAIIGIIHVSAQNNNAEMAAILTSAFTAISTMTTAFFGIKSMSNTAVALRRPDHQDGGSSSGSADTPKSGSAGASGSADTPN